MMSHQIIAHLFQPHVCHPLFVDGSCRPCSGTGGAQLGSYEARAGYNPGEDFLSKLPRLYLSRIRDKIYESGRPGLIKSKITTVLLGGSQS